MGVFASRGLLPRRFESRVHGAEFVYIEVQLSLQEGEYCGPRHLGRVILRLPVVVSAELWIDGRHTPLELDSEVEPG